MDSISDVVEQARAIQKLLEARLENAQPGLLEDVPLEQYILWLDQSVHLNAYHKFPDQAHELFFKLKKYGLPVLADYHRLSLVVLIACSKARLEAREIPHSIQMRLLSSYKKILNKILKVDDRVFSHEKDLFCKDLAICRMKLLPCDAELIDVSAGIPKSLAFRNVSQAVRFAYFYVCVGDTKIWYESHWDRRLLKYFNSQSYEQHYLLVAEMLEKSPDIKGLFGASWWYDPALEKVSPQLAFLQTLPMQNGAYLFDMGSDDATTQDATHYSTERTDLYKSGEYQPTMYFLAWPRKALLKWAAKAKVVGK